MKDEINKAIAIECGWKLLHPNRIRSCEIWVRDGIQKYAGEIDYFGSLDAIHEAWRMPPPKPFTDYFNWNCELGFQLELIVERDFNAAPKWHSGVFNKFKDQIFSAKDYLIANATAPQRCEAFLRTKNPAKAKEIYG
jgi:hypothetical protein